MSDFCQLVPEHIRKLGAYKPGKSRRQAQQESQVNCIKMASNENPFGPSPRAVEAMRTALSDCHFYPDNDAADLQQKLADLHHVAPEQIVPAAGSTALLGLIARILLAPGLNAITSELSFIIYPIATQAAGGTLIKVPMRKNGFDLDAIARAVDENTRLIFLANPNNPTGTIVDAVEVDRFLSRLPDHVLVVLDEAYYDFAQHFAALRAVTYSRSLDYIKQGRKLIVLRTFSKAHGLAGVRVGYGIGPAEFMSYLARARTTFSVSSLAQAAASSALDDEAHIRKALSNNAEQAKWLMDGLMELGISVMPTWANFVYCELGEDAAAIASQLQTEGIIVRPLGGWGAPTAIRVTVGTPEQNQVFIKAFKRIMLRTAVK
jgi:histidinol-phosphate aminotransferase